MPSLIKNAQLDVLIKMEHLIGGNEKVLFGEDKQGVFHYQERVYHKDGTNELVDRVVTIDDFVAFMNVIEELINEKKEASKRVMACRDPQKHRDYNREWAKTHKNKQYHHEYYEKVTKVKRQLAKKGL